MLYTILIGHQFLIWSIRIKSIEIHYSSNNNLFDINFVQICYYRWEKIKRKKIFFSSTLHFPILFIILLSIPMFVFAISFVFTIIHRHHRGLLLYSSSYYHCFALDSSSFQLYFSVIIVSIPTLAIVVSI